MPETDAKHPLELSLSPAEIIALSRCVPAAVEKRAKQAVPAKSNTDVDFCVGVTAQVSRDANAKAKSGEATQKVNFASEAFLLALVGELNPRKARLADAVAAVAEKIKASEDVASLDNPELRAVLLAEAVKTQARLPARPYKIPPKPAAVRCPNVDTRVHPRAKYGAKLAA